MAGPSSEKNPSCIIHVIDYYKKGDAEGKQPSENTFTVCLFEGFCPGSGTTATNVEILDHPRIYTFNTASQYRHSFGNSPLNHFMCLSLT